MSEAPFASAELAALFAGSARPRRYAAGSFGFLGGHGRRGREDALGIEVGARNAEAIRWAFVGDLRPGSRRSISNRPARRPCRNMG